MAATRSNSRIWECRYVARELPQRFQHPAPLAALGERFSVLASELREADDYLLASTPAFNIKLRHRSNSLKMKLLTATAPDGLEYWRTDFDERLPASSEIWNETLQALECGALADEFAIARTVSEAEGILRSRVDAERIVRVDKVRWLYADQTARVEVAQFAIGSREFATVCAESADPGSVRELIRKLGALELGSPCNYITILQRDAGGAEV